ncbi:hypothetical protein PSHT_10549 [Puccinia striiformis]|uniref:CCHC-type domain-containing protein n=1 Tax=Puccinia striiformis TaxID=27350 RepID=A0A2S4V8W3_9BASI|nr:hypothetical protein PSHT_10549 [Puccinia striiformis]
MEALDLCEEQHWNMMAVSASESVFPSPVPPSALATTVDNDMFDVSAFLAEINHSKWVDALDFYVITANKCWQCGGYNHYARNCPDKLRAGTGGKAMGQPLGTIFGTLPSNGPSKAPNPPSRNQEHARGLADFYQPRYASNRQPDRQPLSVAAQAPAKGGVSAQIVDIGDVPDNLDTLGFYNMGLGEDLIPSESLAPLENTSVFEPSKNRWRMPYPMIRLDVVRLNPIERCSILLSQALTIQPEPAPLSPTISSSSVSATQSPPNVISRSFSSVHDLMGSPNSYTSFSSQPDGNAISMLASKAKAPPSTPCFP